MALSFVIIWTTNMLPSLKPKNKRQFIIYNCKNAQDLVSDVMLVIEAEWHICATVC